MNFVPSTLETEFVVRDTNVSGPREIVQKFVFVDTIERRQSRIPYLFTIHTTRHIEAFEFDPVTKQIIIPTHIANDVINGKCNLTPAMIQLPSARPSWIH